MDPTRPRRMRSAAINLGLVGALAVSLTACGGNTATTPRYCVDDFDQVVPDAQCLATPAGSPGSNPRPGTSSRYRYYYGGRTSGGRVTGGSYDPPARSGSSSGSSGVKSSGVDTGGFGGGKSSTGGGKSGSSSSSSGGKSGGSSSSGGS